MSILDTAEGRRLLAAARGEGWRRWRPYLSERQWGTVREDYTPGSTAWDSFPHDHARSRAYRWGEDGVAGFSDERQRWCLSLALWNGHDSTLKERLFGLTNGEGSHGEDAKEAYHDLDGTPTHSYMRMLYRYPQAAFPYAALVAESRRRGADAPGFELHDSGAFEGGGFFDVTLEYAKASPDDILRQVTVSNRGPDAAVPRVPPQLCARNTWSWRAGAHRPLLSLGGSYGVSYEPGESRSGVFGGNSNWRGPVWMPMTLLLVEALRRFHSYYGDEVRVECPVGSGQMRISAEAADEVSDRLVRLFPPAPDGPGDPEPALLFHEHFHGDTGQGLGASHQTGWTSLVALLIQDRRRDA